MDSFINIMKKYYGAKNIIFDKKTNLIGFDNGVFDLDINSFRDYEFTDYITKTVSYDYEEADDMSIVLKIIKMLMVDWNTTDYLLKLFAASLCNFKINKTVLLNSNKKTNAKKMFLCDLLNDTLGDYCEFINLSKINKMNKIKDGTIMDLVSKNVNVLLLVTIQNR